MSGVTSGETSLPIASGSDILRDFLKGPLVTAEQTLADKFDSSTGHAHSGSGEGRPIGSAGIASGVTLTNPVLNGAVSGTAGFGAWTAFTPTLAQNGVITTSTAAGFYVQIGKLVIATVELASSGTGSAGVEILIGGLPVGSQQRGSGCWGKYSGATTNYSVTAYNWQSSTSVRLITGAQASGAVLGVAPSFAVASGDVISLTFVYEAV